MFLKIMHANLVHAYTWDVEPANSASSCRQTGLVMQAILPLACRSASTPPIAAVTDLRGMKTITNAKTERAFTRAATEIWSATQTRCVSRPQLVTSQAPRVGASARASAG